jgi:uncharacterized membrane protein SpoIIM required for sporulation
MEYTQFVRLRRPTWESFAAHLAVARENPRLQSYRALEELATEYRQVLHDYALAAARYPSTEAARRLALLSVEGTFVLTLQERERRSGLLAFFARSFPAAVRRQGDLILVAVGIFAVAVVFGLLLGAVQPSIGLAFLGNQAAKGLSEGHLWTESLTSSVPPAFSSSRIATNNLGVALLAWSGGALAGLVPLYMVLLNGFMLGSLISVTLHYSMATQLFTFVASHGPLELTLILFSAAGGLGIGRALVAAGDRPRGVALREAGRDALRLLGGCLPWFVLLGVIEGTVSPATEVPVALKIGIGLALEALFLTLALHPVSEQGESR